MDKYEKEKNNIQQLEDLPEVIKDITLTIQNEDINVELIKKHQKKKGNINKYFYTIDHEEFPESYNVIRLYLPLMGGKGYVPTSDEIIKLFKEETILPPEGAFLSSKGNSYSLESIKFKPFAENVVNGKKLNFYGEVIPEFKSNK
ncbi:hypothetical protein [Staphylococcus cohnii]|uniref:hypothetical protein n=2 Tax=Staphylococcus cohnii TaxID=29382 RepID=UPI003D7D3E51